MRDHFVRLAGQVVDGSPEADGGLPELRFKAKDTVKNIVSRNHDRVFFVREPVPGIRILEKEIQRGEHSGVEEETTIDPARSSLQGNIDELMRDGRSRGGPTPELGCMKEAIVRACAQALIREMPLPFKFHAGRF